ncbi:intestinal mucin-like protein [Aplochiton taeniatus]
MVIQCNPITCPTPVTETCSKPGQRLVNKTDGCCETQVCECDMKLCPITMMSCQPGFEAVITMANGSCCPSYNCVPKGVCVYNGTEYQPGSKVPKETCEVCYCGTTVDPTSQLNNINCTAKVCNTVCTQGYEYQSVYGQCCGNCVQISCVFTTPDNATHTLQVNENWSPPGDKCVTYKCELVYGKYSTKEIMTTCPAFNPADCVPGTETTDAQGCCRSCTVRSSCQLQSKLTILEVNGCKSLQPLKVSYCEGQCGSSSMYSATANKMMHQCQCCQEMTTSQRETELSCLDGSKVKHIYITVETCSCRVTECASGVTTTSASTKLRRRKR